MKKIKTLLLLLFTTLALCSAGTSVAVVSHSAISDVNAYQGVAFADEQDDSDSIEKNDTEDCD